MSKESMPITKLLIPKNGEDKIENNLVIYTLTAGIAVALFINVISPFQACNPIFHYLRFISALALATSVILIFLAIERLFDLLPKSENRNNKYRDSLIFYNLSIIGVIFSIVSILLCFTSSEFPCLCDKCCPVTLCIFGAFIFLVCSFRWFSDTISLILKHGAEVVTSSKDSLSDAEDPKNDNKGTKLIIPSDEITIILGKRDSK